MPKYAKLCHSGLGRVVAFGESLTVFARAESLQSLAQARITFST